MNFQELLMLYLKKNTDLSVQYGELDTVFKLPLYDINNMPISVWFFEEENKQIGFIVAGHATKTICEIASTEVMTKLQDIGMNTSSIFSFGIGYDLRNDNTWNERYDSLLLTMRNKFVQLRKKYPEQVVIDNIDFAKYTEIMDLIKQHIQNADQNTAWDSYMIEYEYHDQPLIVPFYTINDTLDKIKFQIPKSLFGKIPTDAVSYSLSSGIVEMENKIENLIKENKREIGNVEAYNNLDNEKIFSYWTAVENGFVMETALLEGYGTPPEGWRIVTKENGRVIDSRNITFIEAVEYLNDPTIEIDPYDRMVLEEWTVKARENKKSYNNRKGDIVIDIILATSDIRKELETLSDHKRSLLERDNQDFIIDAFLRGWPFDTESIELNKRLDVWYETRRKVVWDYILDQIPNAQVQSKLAGIFHSDDVYFQISSSSDNYIVVPYKIIGGNFVQVIDKKVGICQFYTSSNFRFVSK